MPKISYAGLICLLLIICNSISAQSPFNFKKPFTTPFRVDSHYPHYLSNQDSDYLFILNRTAWAYFVCEYPEDVIRKAKEQAVTVIRVAMEGTPYKEVLKYDMWPWGGTREKPDYSKINEPYGCEGINDTTYVSPGQEFLKPLSDFFQSIPFWTFNPNYSICQLSPDSLIHNTLCDERRNMGITYICTKTTRLEISGARAHYRLPNGTYRIEFFNPATNVKISEKTVVSTNLRNQYPVEIPNFTDDILLKMTKMETADQTIIPGTR